MRTKIQGPLRGRGAIRVLGCLCALAVLAAASLASAQQNWLPDRMRSEGDGFRTQRLEIHPSFAAEAGVDSNVFLQANNPTLAALMRLTGAVYIQPRRVDGDGESSTSSSDGRTIDFNLGLTASYYHFFTQSARDNVSGTLDAGLRIRPQGRIGLDLRESFSRMIRPFTDSTGSGGGKLSYGQNRSQTSANVTFRSPGGVIRGQVGYTADLTFFDSALFSPNNSIEHRVATRLSWAFFPRTVLFYEGGAAFRSYGFASDGTPFAQLVNSRQVNSSVGVNGVLTEKLSMTLSAGYAAGFFATGSEYDGFLARAELRYRIRAGITATLGYNRSYQASYIGNFLQQDTGYFNLEAAFAGRFVVGTQATVAYGTSGLARSSDGGFLGTYQTRVDVRTMLRLYGEYRPTSWLALTASLEYMGDFTNYAFTNPMSMPGAIPDPGARYQRVDAWLGARVYH